MKTKSTFFAVFLLLAQITNAYCLESSLFPRFSGKTVKIYIADVKDSSKDHDLDLALVKLRIETVLKDRKSINFKTVATAQEADIIMHTEIVGFQWTDHDPIDMLVGVGGTAMDAAVIEDYASMEADVTVSEVKTDKPLWKKRLFATITKKPMSKTESVPLVTDNFVKVFIKDCFSKRRA